MGLMTIFSSRALSAITNTCHPYACILCTRSIGVFKDASLFDELKLLLRERVVAATSDGDKDAEAQKSRKRARKEEVCVQGERLQFTYRYRKTFPRSGPCLFGSDYSTHMHAWMHVTCL